MNGVQLALRVLRVDRRARTSAVLTGVGVAVATALVVLLTSLPSATQSRAERAQWQQPAGTGDTGPLSLSVTEDFAADQEITRLDVATADPSTVDLPPGVPALPGPGELLLSPALAERLAEQPAEQLGNRYQGTRIGTIGQDALAYPGQLVAVLGHSTANMPVDAVDVAGFASGPAEADPQLALLAGVGVVVLLVPSLVLVASAARLTAARRERRLAALRLAGATPRQVVSGVAAETAIAAVGGTLLGLAAGPGARALAVLVPWDGGTWLATDFDPPTGLFVLTVVGIPVLVVLAAVLGLRRVVYTPLGASTRRAPKPLHWWRLLSVPVAIAAFLVAVAGASGAGGSLVVLAGIGAMLASAALVGPWLTSAVGGLFVRWWRRPAGLLAGRRLRDDPKGAYRASAGLVLAVFTGSMALTLLPSFEAQAGGGGPFEDSVLYLETDREHAARIVERADAELARHAGDVRVTALPQVRVVVPGGGMWSAVVADCATADRLLRFDLAGECAKAPGIYGNDLGATAGLSVTGESAAEAVPFAEGTPVHPAPTSDERLSGTGQVIVDPAVLPEGVPADEVLLAVPATAENREVVRTALVAASDGAAVSSRELRLAGQQTQLSDLRRVTVIGLGAAALLAGCSAAIATAGSVLDRRRTFGALLAAGTPVGTLARALRSEAALPGVVATLGAGAVGVLAAVGLLRLMGDEPVLSAWILAPVVLGAAVAVFAAAACRPALNRVRAEPLADE